MNRLLLCGVALASLFASAAPAAPAAYDWCSSVAVRPDLRRREGAGGRCEAAWSDEEVAAGARVVLLGSHADVAVANEATAPWPRCGMPETHRAQGEYVARLRALRAKAGGDPLRIVHESRFDVVAAPLAAEPGFDADFLLETDRPWSEVLAFFAADRAPACQAGGCGFTTAYGAWEDRGRGTWLGDWIDASGGPRRHEKVVYYLVRPAGVRRLFWPTAALADQRDAAYRAWRVQLAKRAMAIGGYDAIDLNTKFHQYREPYWIGSRKAPDVAALRAQPDETLWTAPPRGYGYPEYVQGWVALAADLRAAGVPYAITSLSAWPWPKTHADDPTTRDRDEARMIRDVVKGARLVLLDRARKDAAGLEAWAAELERAGVEIVRVDTRCGYARQNWK